MDNYFKASDILDKAISTDAYFQIKSILLGTKTADVAPVVHAQWEDDTCTNCGYGVYPWNNTGYCPNCGARMDKEGNT